ncbi:uncharacterized protein THITE_2114891 [Thermothielavioides terrestris NRRL 8126]|uniref:Uncharacterized protein n=1 Tax=Thermothielavioides terrestris (strain ATCC 38088 / NRRL 8126) TaxID=578455 RepID=G2R273_THETT|nr:uncharacterized protein THITE_2114891 [Thermothielavioides terrestris NRRL 8126]AEO66657.1 hypothetical protein THITE_2114891 [Thermothielavioides terrestris NRRL 8126]
MADSDGSHPLDKESDDLVPLPAAHRRGLAVISALACLSVASSTAVLLYLTVKLVRWHWRNRVRRKATEASAAPAVDLSLGLSEHHLMGDDTKHDLPPAPKKAQINQFVVLIYNLLLADIHQSAAFLSNTVWLSRDGIYVRTSACWAQGWLVSTGDLASSLFITAIAVHTYLAVVRKYTPPQCAVYITVVGLWVFNYLIAALGVAITRNGRDTGGYFVRAAAWCWVNIRYENLRLYLHYLWIFIALAITIILYTLIFLSLRRRSTRPPPSVSDSRTNIHEHPPPLSASSSNTKTPGPPTTTTITTTTTALEPLPDGTTLADNAIIINSSNSNTSSTEGHHKAFLLYPLIYLLCTAPLALGRIATMAGADVPIAYFCAAGALITSNGWLDVLLWGATRHRLLFGADVDFPDDGDALATFAFMRTPHERRWGNMVWVEGGGGGDGGGGKRASGGVGRGMGGRGDGSGRGGPEEAVGLGRWFKRRMGWRPLGFGGGGGGGGDRGAAGGGRGVPNSGREERGAGGEDGLAIQMDTVTTVVVEPAGPEGTAWYRRRGGHAAHGSTGVDARVYDTDSGTDDRLGKEIS